MSNEYDNLQKINEIIRQRNKDYEDFEVFKADRDKKAREEEIYAVIRSVLEPIIKRISAIEEVIRKTK